MLLSPAALLLPLVKNHIVHGRVIFPGAGYLEMARASAVAASKGAALHGVFFLQPLAAEAASLHVACVVGDGRFEVRSGETEGNVPALEDMALHCSGGLDSGVQDGPQHVNQACARSQVCMRAADLGLLYDGFYSVGLQYGPIYRTLEQAWSCLLYTSPSPRDKRQSRMPSSA